MASRVTGRLPAGCAAGVIAFMLVAGAFAAPTPPPNIFTLEKVSSKDFLATYHYDAPAGAKPINGMTIQAVSATGAPVVISSFVLGGVTFKPTHTQDALAGFPLKIKPGTMVTGRGMMSDALRSGTKFKFYVTNNSFASTGGTFPVDVSLGVPSAPVASHATFGPGSPSFSYSAQWGGFLTGHGKTTIRGGYRLLYEPSFYNVYLKQNAPPGGVKEIFGGSLSGPGTVEIAIDQTASNQCRWLIDDKGDFKMQACTSPIWLPAAVTGKKWTYSLQRLLPPGQYAVESRASSQGTSESAFSATQHNLVELDVVLGKK